MTSLCGLLADVHGVVLVATAEGIHLRIVIQMGRARLCLIGEASSLDPGRRLLPRPVNFMP